MSLSKVAEVAEGKNKETIQAERDYQYLWKQEKDITKSVPKGWPKVVDFKEIGLGDHVCYYYFPYYRHGIIIEKHDEHQIISLLRYHISRRMIDKQEIQYTDSYFYVLYRDSKKKINLLQAKYNGPCFDSDTVVQRALARCSEKQYNPFTNFARAFPRWCKTGTGGLTALNQIHLFQSREVIKDINILTKGDHIMFDRGSYSHHAIVLSVIPDESKIKVIHFTSDKGTKAKIMEEEIIRHKEHGTLLRLNYRTTTESEPDHVISRATLVEKEGFVYNLFVSNCEHLATWCKTGIWNSGQVKDLVVYMSKQFISFGVKISSHVLVRIISESFASLVDLVIRFYNKAKVHELDLISCMIYVVIDIAWNIYDVREKYKRGELKGEALEEEIIKRVVRCLVVDSSVVLGNILGQLFIPTPILGAFVGGLCGLALGELINFLIQKIVAILKSKQAKCLWEKSKKQLSERSSNLAEMVTKLPCLSHSDKSCIGPAQ